MVVDNGRSLRAASLHVLHRPGRTGVGARESGARGPAGDQARLYRNAHDPKDTGFLERAADIRLVFLALPHPINVALAVGALAGLRPGRSLAHLGECGTWGPAGSWSAKVQSGKLTGLKDDASRVVSLGDSLLPVLEAYHLRTGGTGLLFRASERGGQPGRPAHLSAAAHPLEGTEESARGLFPSPPLLVFMHSSQLRLSFRDGGRQHRTTADHHGPRERHDHRTLQPSFAVPLRRARAVSDLRGPDVPSGTCDRPSLASSGWCNRVRVGCE